LTAKGRIILGFSGTRGAGGRVAATTPPSTPRRPFVTLVGESGRLTGDAPSTIARNRQDRRSVALGSGMAGNGLSGGRMSRLASCGRAVASKCRSAAPIPAAPTM